MSLPPSPSGPASKAPSPVAAQAAGAAPANRLQAEFQATGERATSLWPDSTRAPGGPSTSFAISRFDPLAEERARLQTQAAAAFDVCHPALALRAVVVVQVVLAIVALADAQNLADWAQRQASLAFGGVAGTLLWLVAVCALRKALRTATPLPRVGVVLALGGIVAVVGWWPVWWAGLGGPASAWRIGGVALAGVAFAALLWAWLDLRARIWHPANASARLAELQSRIRPHFLFNALNTALALVRVDPERAENVLEDLAQLFRVALAEVGASVSLEEEIELARRYLAIEEVRFGKRLKVQWDIDPAVHSARVPPLVLQPLVENAVRHGIEPAARGGSVSVRAQVQRGQAVVQVSNSLGGPTDGPANPGHGMALHNVRERLRLLHDVAAECTVWQEGGVFHARVVLPLITKP
jgi:two-component system, LytTR family, sensor histidine kinase AlgZ